MKKEKTITILSIFTIIFTVIGGTLAYWSWDTTEAQKTLVTFSVADNFSCSVDGGGNITSNTHTVAPASCTNSTYAIKREISTTVEVDGNEPITMDLVINVNNLGTGLTNSQNFMYALTEAGSSSCSENVISQGSFNGKTTGNTISILNKTYEETTTETYDLWIWLDSVERSSSTQNQPFNLSLGGTCTDTSMDYFYAVYSSTDYDLRFYDRTETEIRSLYGNQERDIDAMYKVYNNAVYTEVNPAPWSEYAGDIEAVYVEDTISPSNTAYWFSGFEYSRDIDLTKLDTSNVISMAYMFYKTGYGYEDFNPTGLSSWNTSNVKNMSYMFSEAGYSTFNPGDISGWNTSNVKDMSYMFNYAGEEASINLDLSGWNVSSVRNMRYMFEECGYEDKFDIGNLDNWNTSNVTDMRGMFMAAGESATSYNIGNLSTKLIVNPDGTTYTAWDVSNVTDMSYMFSAAGGSSESFNIGNLSNWDVSNVTNMQGMFSNACTNATTCVVGDLSNWNTYNVQNMSYMFNYFGSNDKNLDISYVGNWNVSNVTNMQGMFGYTGYNTDNFSLDLSKWNTSKVTNMNFMFQNTGYKSSSFEIIGLDNFNTKNVTSMPGMFQNVGYSATAFNIGDISGWNTSKVTNMNNMFQNTGFTDLDWSLNLRGWNVSSVSYHTNFNTGSETKVTLPLAWQS